MKSHEVQQEFHDAAWNELKRFVNLLQVPGLFDGDEETRKKLIKRILKGRK
jgi:hypothetical protein